MTAEFHLTPEQQALLQQGDAVPVQEAATRLDCVVLRADVFDQVKALLPSIDPREAYPALDEAMRAEWDTPQMADYDDYDSRRK